MHLNRFKIVYGVNTFANAEENASSKTSFKTTISQIKKAK